MLRFVTTCYTLLLNYFCRRVIPPCEWSTLWVYFFTRICYHDIPLNVLMIIVKTINDFYNWIWNIEIHKFWGKNFTLLVRVGNGHSMSYQPDNLKQTSYIICNMEFAVNLEWVGKITVAIKIKSWIYLVPS